MFFEVKLPGGPAHFSPTMRTLLVVTAVLLLGCRAREAAPAAPLPNLPVPEVPAQSKWVIDPENSSASFVARHVFTNVRGMMHQPTGAVTLDDATPANSSASATLAVRTIDTGVPERDTHLQSADFFDAARFPTITFASTRFAPASGGGFTVTGTLTMHGVSKPVTLAVTLSPPFNHAGGIRRGLEATTRVNRRDFGIAWDFPGEGTGVVVGDEVNVTIDLELVLQR